MKQKIIKCIFLLCFSTALLPSQAIQIVNDREENPENIDPGKPYRHHCHNPACPHYEKENKPKPSEKETLQLAIATLANMAQGVLAIGWDPHNPDNVTNNVTNIIGNFANFVAHAMNKSIDIETLINDEEFIVACKQLLISKAEIVKKKYQQ